MEGCAIREAALKLEEEFLVTAIAPEPVTHQHEAAGAVSGAGNAPLPFALRRIECSHPYPTERGVNPEVARHFGLGYNRGKGSMGGRIVTPIHDENGFLVAYAGRSIDQTEPRHRFPARFRKSQVPFNLHRAAAEGRSVIVVEGFFDCLKGARGGIARRSGG